MAGNLELVARAREKATSEAMRGWLETLADTVVPMTVTQVTEVVPMTVTQVTKAILMLQYLTWTEKYTAGNLLVM
jgi:hypothetical protein